MLEVELLATGVGQARSTESWLGIRRILQRMCEDRPVLRSIVSADKEARDDTVDTMRMTEIVMSDAVRAE